MKPIALLPLILLACSGRFGADDGASSPDGGSWLDVSPRALACRDLAITLCARIDECAPFLARTATGPSCVTDQRDRCLRMAGLGGSARAPEVVTACAARVRSAQCSEVLTRYPETCDAPPGALADGVPCVFHEQCASTFCARELDTACGRCGPIPGGRCVGGECGRGFVCTLAGSCVIPAAIGSACGPNVPCERLGFCDVDTCKPRRALDAPCAGFGECDPFGATACAQDSICRATAVVGLGEPCALTANALVLCEAPARCIDGRCRAPKREGEACATSNECAAECLRGRCVLRTVETCPQD